METPNKQESLELHFLRNYLKGEVTNENGYQALKICPAYGEGEVRCIYFHEGLISMEFDILLNQDISIPLEDAFRKWINFMCICQGNCFYTFRKPGAPAQLKAFQTAVVANEQGVESELYIRKDQRLILNLFRFDADTYIGKIGKYDDNRLAMLDTLATKKGYIQVGRLNLEIGELIKTLEYAKYVKNSSALMRFEEICYQILRNHIEQFNIGLLNEQQLVNFLSGAQDRTVYNSTAFEKNYPEAEYSLVKLGNLLRFTATNLKQGYRFIETKVNDGFLGFPNWFEKGYGIE